MEVGSSSALLLEVPAVPPAVAPAESDRIKLLLPRACERNVSSLVFLPLLYLLRFLFFAAWLALEQAVQGARLVFLISGLVCSCFASLVPGQDKSPFSRTRQETYCHVSPWRFLSCCGSRRIDGTTVQERKPCSFSQKEPTSAQTAQPGAFCQPLLVVLPLPAQ